MPTAKAVRMPMLFVAVASSLALVLCLISTQPAFSFQTTISTGSIIGTVADPSGAAVPGALITITNKATGHVMQLKSNAAGTYNSGGLLPGDYLVRVEAKGFNSIVIPITVQVGVTSSGNATLQVGSTSTVVQVQASNEVVNTVQPTIQGVLTAQQIQQLPINGRNFLDLAQLEPGVQIQDGADFDPTKNGFSSISFSGRFGRTARIEIDGVDISDETVGTTTMNIPASAIQEFQVEESSLDLTTELTSSGAVNVTTKSGGNQFHGGGYYYGRWNQLAARIAPDNLFFRREQFGANVGGPIVKNKLFFFMDWERTRQDLSAPVLLGAPFSALSSSVNEPFKEHDLDGRLDWQIKSNIHAFYRFTYNINSDVVPFIPNTFSPFLNRDHAQDHVAGLDFTTGSTTHQIRFGYLRFANQITDATTGSGIYNPAPGIELALGGDSFCLTAGLDPFCSGINFLAPQATQQHDLQTKYDGSTVHGTHIIRYGFDWNHILGGGFASFLALAPAVGDNFTAADQTAAASGPFPGGASNPLNYPVDSVTMGNGVGFSTPYPQFGFPAGGQFDNRMQAYIGDTWKMRHNFVVDWGLRYVRDTGRDDNQLAPVSALNQFGAGLGNRPHQPNLNFAPQLGFAWDPTGTGKTVIRAGAGLYYENDVFNNILFDAPARLQKGLFLGFAPLTCPAGTATFPGGAVVSAPGICGAPIGSAASAIAALQKQYQAATISAGPAANGSYIGTTLTDNANTSTNLIAPDFRTPFSWQFNAGISRQLFTNTVLSVDYVRNVALHYLLFYDTNHVGDARYLDKGAAMNAINATNTSFGCPAGTGGINCTIAAGATINDYAGNGLDSGAALAGGFPGCNCAFPGVNPNLGQNEMLFPIGRSVYNALDVSLRQNVTHPLPGLRGLSLQASYALSRYEAMANDSDFINGATDFANTSRYFGPTGLDRTDQFSVGAVGTLPGGFQLSFITHAYTSLPSTLFVPPGPQREPTTAQIFQSDLTGDGTTGDVLPGTNLGSFGRQANGGNINQFIGAYNTNYAGKPTPAGTALVNAGLFTVPQLQALGGVAQPIAIAPLNQVSMGGLFTADLGLTYVIHLGRIWSRLGEDATLEPKITIYNLTNSSNYDFANNPLSGILNGSSGSANGTTYTQRTNKVTMGSGVFDLGGPRVLEFGARFTF
ncbi:MAG: carboxypeptidase regulatory-like domain-containing protein [Terriglobia bacterium]